MEANKNVIFKIRNLLKRAEANSGASIQEAITCGEIAQRLMETYRISYELVMESEDGNIPKNIAQEAVIDYIKEYKTNFTPVRNPTDWVKALMNVVARANNCEVYVAQFQGEDEEGKPDNFSGFSIVGRGTDILAVSEIFFWLFAEILRIGFLESRGKDNDWLRDFRIGAVQKLKEKFEAIKTSPEFTEGFTKDQLERAITRIDNKRKEVQDFFQEMMKSGRFESKESTKAKDNIAFSRGYKAAENISIDAPKTLDSKNEKKLPSGN